MLKAIAIFESGGGGGGQTPWTSDINAAGFSLNNVNGISGNGDPVNFNSGINMNSNAITNSGDISLAYGNSIHLASGGGGGIDGVNQIYAQGFNGTLNGDVINASSVQTNSISSTNGGQIGVINGLVFGGAQGISMNGSTLDMNGGAIEDSNSGTIIFSGNGNFSGVITGDGSGITNISASSISGLATVATTGNYSDLNSPPFNSSGQAQTNISFVGQSLTMYSASFIKDQSGNNSINVTGRTFYDSSGSSILIDASGTINGSSGFSFSGQHPVFSSTVRDGNNKDSIDVGNRIGYASDGTTSIINWNSTSGLALGKKLISYNGVGANDAVVVRATQRFAAQTAAKASVTSLTAQTGDATYLVSANVNITTATLFNFTVTCAYTDETNTSRTLTLPFVGLAGTSLTALVNTGGAGPYSGSPQQIRAKGGTTVTIATTGTFTTVTYNVEGLIAQTAN